MGHYKYSSEQIAEKGESIYQQKVSSGLVKEDKGKYVAVDIETEQVAVGDDLLTVGDPIREAHPDAAIYVARVGHPTATRLGHRHKIVEARS